MTAELDAELNCYVDGVQDPILTGNGHGNDHGNDHGNGHANGRGAGNGGNGRHHHQPRRQIVHDIHGVPQRRTAVQGDMAAFLVAECGKTVSEALIGCGISAKYYYAMKALRESGNVSLRNRALKGGESPLTAAKRVENAAAAIVALKKCSVLERELVRLATGMTDDPATMLFNLTPDQLAAAGKAFGVDKVWDRMIAPNVT